MTRALAQPWYRRPLWHFLILGTVVYLGVAWWEGRQPYEVPYPGAARIQQLHDGWLQQTGHPPEPAELRALIREDIDASMLFAEALRRNLHRSDPVVYQRLLRNAEFLGVEGSERQQVRLALEMGLHKGDEVVRRRLIQRMQAEARAVSPPTPTEAELRERYRTQQERWRVPAGVRLEHRYFALQRGAGQARRDAAAARLWLNPDGDATAVAGDPFLHGQRLPLLDRGRLERYFGGEFAEALFAQLRGEAAPAHWLGPLRSTYGYHLVWVHEYRPARYRGFEEVRATLLAEWLEEWDRKAERRFVALLRERYEVLQ